MRSNKIYRKDGKCFYELIDGGVFANSPTILLPVILRNTLTGKATQQCSAKFAKIISSPYPVFWTDYSSDGTPYNYVMKRNEIPPRDADWSSSYGTTVVQVGTGYFEHFDDHNSDMLDVTAGVLLGMGITGIISGVVGVGLYMYQRYQNKQDNKISQFLIIFKMILSLLLKIPEATRE